MTAVRVEDLFLADDIDALPGNFSTTAEAIRSARTHEEVEAIKASVIDFIVRVCEVDL